MNKESEILKGLVIRTSRNNMTVRIESAGGKELLECKIKGKVLKTEKKFYNPIAPGDIVCVQRHKNKGEALILSVEKRRNFFSRFNQKDSSSQILAANVDYILCLCTSVSPPFRPRFIDRALLQADSGGIEAIVICNKIDIEYNNIDVDERIEEYARIGYKVLKISAKTGEGIEELRRVITGKTCALTGQSGVGKSSLINALQPGLNIREGRLNEKYDRGVHTTTMSYMFELSDGTRLIDTPGVRRFIPDGIKPEELVTLLREFSPLAGKCSFGLSCSHRTECGCKIMEAVAAGLIHEDRYESFLRITDDLEGKYTND